MCWGAGADRKHGLGAKGGPGAACVRELFLVAGDGGTYPRCRVTSHVPDHGLGIIRLDIEADSSASTVRGVRNDGGGSVPFPVGEHHLLDCLAKLLGGSVVAGGQFTNRAVDIGLAPEQRGTIVKQVEVVGIVALHLDYLELDVLVIQSPERLVRRCSCRIVESVVTLSHLTPVLRWE